MSAAAFVLAINVFIAFTFATAFGVVAVYARSALGARWLALAYGVGLLNPALEFMLPGQVDPRPMQVAIFAVILLALSLCVIGLARHYRVKPPWRLLTVVIVASLVVNVLIIDMPRDSLLRGVLYQTPYALVQAVGVATILRYRHRQALDLALVLLAGASGLHFMFKPFLAALIGSGATPQAYIGSTYAAISQSVGAMLLIANGLVMLLIIVRDAMAEMTARSETDTLSGLLNRRGFEDRADKLLAATMRNGMPATLVLADLDHFKAINDSLGHEAGDRVIMAFAEILEATPAPRAIVGRLGGEEFGVFIPGANVAAARLYAECVRIGFSSVSIAGLGPDRRVSASFGVAELTAGDSLSDLLRRSDAALYEAKQSGRNRVCVASADTVPPRLVSASRVRRQGSRQGERGGV